MSSRLKLVKDVMKKFKRSGLDPSLENANRNLASSIQQLILSKLKQEVRKQGATKLSIRTGLARPAIYRMLKPVGNPKMKNLLLLVTACGLYLRLEQHAALMLKPKGISKCR